MRPLTMTSNGKDVDRHRRGNFSTSRPAAGTIDADAPMFARLCAVTTDLDERWRLALMLALTFGTGVIDAVGFLGLDQVFTGNMTGNVVILGMGIAGAEDLPILGPFVALVGFLAGATIGGRALRRAPGHWTGRVTVLFGVVSIALLSAAIVLLTVEVAQGTTTAYGVTTTLGAAMGLQAATARYVAVREITTVVVTSTLTGLAADSVLGAGKPGSSGRRVLAVLLITAGAATGALLLQVHIGLGVLLAAGICAGVAALGAWRRPVMQM